MSAHSKRTTESQHLLRYIYTVTEQQGCCEPKLLHLFNKKSGHKSDTLSGLCVTVRLNAVLGPY